MGTLKWMRGLVLATALLAPHGAVPTWAQVTPPALKMEKMARAFVAATYPELRGKVVETFPWAPERPDRISVRVRDKNRVVPPLDRIEKRDAELFEADMRFDGDRLSSVLVDGTHVHSGVLRTLNWNRTEDVAADEATLQRAVETHVGRSGPANRAAFLKTLELSRLATVLGKTRLLDVSFPTGAGAVPRPMPQWMVRFEAVDTRHTTICYGAFFEPFDGRLMALESWMPGQRADSSPGRC